MQVGFITAVRTKDQVRDSINSKLASSAVKNNVLSGLGSKKKKKTSWFVLNRPKMQSKNVLTKSSPSGAFFFVRGNTLNRFRLVDLGGGRATQKIGPIKLKPGAEHSKSQEFSNFLS